MAASPAQRALVTTSTFPRWKGDATASFVRDLADLAMPLWDVTVLAPHHPGALAAETMGALDVVRFSYFFPRSLERLCYGAGILPNASFSLLAKAQVPALLTSALAATRRLLRKHRFDLVHAHFLLPQGVVAAAALARNAESASIPLVVSVHGSDLFALTGRCMRALQRAVLDRATLVTANSDATADELRRRAPGVAAKLVTLPMGFDEQVFHPEDPPADAMRGHELLYVGRLSEQKGLRVLLDALPRVLQSAPEARLVVVGEGSLLAALSAQAAALGVERRVELVGPLGHAEVARRYRSSAALVVPSLSGPLGVEGQGLVAIEAMASGCPVVATRSGGLASLIGSDERGRLAPPGDSRALADAIIATLSAPEESRQRARAARAFVLERYAWRALRPTLLGVYAEAVDRARGSPRWA